MISEGMKDFLIYLIQILPVVIMPIYILAFFPLIAVFYGWYTQNRIVASLLGALPLPVLMIVSILLKGLSPLEEDWILGVIVYFLSLIGVGGLCGYFASFETKKYLAAAFGFSFLWMIICLSITM
ncbi:MAG: hypothetical protein PHI15_07225 [Methanomicrobium sp.]|nr:hypothetical protein [Methanomicrobium sp.]